MLKQDLITQDRYSIKCPYSMNPQGICIHNTANNASAKNEVAYMKRNNNQVSFHIAIDDIEAIQVIPFNRNAWHAGDGGNGKGNRNYIGIEICYSTGDINKFKNAEKRAAKEVADLLKQYGWGIDKVKKHQDFSGKYCPHKTLDLGWDRFLNLIKEEMNISTPKPETPKPNNSFTVKITADVLNVRAGAGTNYKVNTTVKRNEVYTIVEVVNGWGKLKSGAGWISLDYTSYNSTPKPEPPKTPQVGSKIKITGNKYSTGQTIPQWVKNNTYTIKQVGNGKVLVNDIVSWVNNGDYTLL